MVGDRVQIEFAIRIAHELRLANQAVLCARCTEEAGSAFDLRFTEERGDNFSCDPSETRKNFFLKRVQDVCSLTIQRIIRDQGSPSHEL